jgi:hypothetical protein
MERHPLEKGAAFCSVVAIVIAAVGLISLTGVEQLFDNGNASSAQLLLRGLALALCVLNLPLWLPPNFWARKQNPVSHRPWTYPLTQLLVILAMAALGGSARVLDVPVWWVAAVLAAPSTVFTFVAFVRGSRPLSGAALLVLAGLFGVWTASMVWGASFLTPLYEAKLAIGTTHIDTLFHVSIANMLDTYAVPSTGIDGVAYVPYNVGSHLLFLLLAHLIDTDILAFYNLVYPVVFLPLLYFALVGLSLALRSAFYAKRKSESVPGRQSGSDAWGWLVLITGFVGLLPQTLALQMGVWNNIMRGESFALAMILLILTLSAMFWAAQDLFQRTEERPPPALRNWALREAPFALALIGLTKVTVMLAALPSLGYLMLRLKLYRQRVYWVAAAMICLLVAAVYAATRGTGGASGGGGQLSLFDFFRKYVRGDLRPYSPLFYFFWVWLLIGVRLYSERVRTLGDVRDKFAANRFLDLEFVIVLAVTSSLPGILMALPAGAANYFSEVHNWVALAFVMACAGPIVREGR